MGSATSAPKWMGRTTRRCCFVMSIGACATARGSAARNDSGAVSEALITARAPLPVSIWGRAPTRRLPFPLDDPRCRVFQRARHGLWYALRAAGVAPGDEALAPAYHHGSEIEALLRAGLVCRFYDATETLAPDESELEALLTPRTRALHLIHYIGFLPDAARWRRW